MDRANTIMERLGFKKDANDEIKAAFVKNLIKQAYGVEVEVPPQYCPQATQPQTLEELNAEVLAGRIPANAPKPPAKKQDPAQLSFDLGDSPKKVG
jgi:1,2-phenylacetyl-CoA epoxidase catalytic subunit